MKDLIILPKNDEARKSAQLFNLKIVEKLPSEMVIIKLKKDEEKAEHLALEKGVVYIKCEDWKILPLENLIAKCKGKGKIIAVVENINEAKLALQTMELGADGVLLETSKPSEVEELASLLQSQSNKVELQEAKVVQIKTVSLGERSCVDTCTRMQEGEGLLVGSSSQGMLLVQAEVLQNELAAPRPFRVNAGALALYTLTPNSKTKYLEELSAGDEVMLVKRSGENRPSVVARSKIEVRPLVLVEVESSDGRIAKALLQNAETIRLVSKQDSIPVTKLKIGDLVLCHFQKGGRHFGTLIEKETITEK